MKIIIDIPEGVKEAIDKDLLIYGSTIREAVKNGISLKGHGNIYDENDIKKGIKNHRQRQTVLNELKLVKPIIEAEREKKQVAIKDFDMPEDCYSCPFYTCHNYAEDDCRIIGKGLYHVRFGERHEECPLVVLESEDRR